MSQKTQEYAQQILSRMVYPDMPMEDSLRLVQSTMARSALPMFAEGGEVEKEVREEDRLKLRQPEASADTARPTSAETLLARSVFPDLPVAQAVEILRGGNRQGKMLSGNIGARVPLGKDTEAMLMLAGSRPEGNQASSKELLAILNQRIGEGNVGATLVRPVDAPPGFYAGDMSASYPLGQGQIRGNVNAVRFPDGQTRMTGYGAGYGGRVGSGNLSVGVSRQGNSGPFSGQLSYRIPLGRAEGSPKEGEAAPTQEEIDAANRPATVNPMIQRKGEAAKRLAAMRDVNTLPDPRTYSAVSGFLGTNPDEQGFSVMHPDREGIRQAGETGFNAGTALQVVPVVGMAGKAAKMLEDITVGNIQRGQVRRAGAQAENIPDTAYDPLRQRMQASGNLAYAVKPKGGTSAYTPEDLNRAKPISALGELFQKYKVSAREADASDEIQAFIEAKAPKYFANTYGTVNDPLRLAINSRRIKLFGEDAAALGPYLDNAAMQGDSQAQLANKIGLEKAYDKLTGSRPYALKSNSDDYQFTLKMEKDISEKIGQQGAPIEMRNLPIMRDFASGEFKRYPIMSETLRRLYTNQEAMPPNIQQALRTGEPIYDAMPEMALLNPDRVIEALQEVPANKLGNMSFPEALIQGTQALAPVRDYLTAVSMAAKGASVPRKVLDKFTSPVMDAPSFGGQWVTLDKSIATEMEGKLMKHSVGDYNFGDKYSMDYTGLPYGGKKAFDEGLVRVYSLRDEQGLPKVTVEMAKSNAGKGDTWNVSQIKGRFNSEPPPETRDDIFRLFDKVDNQEGLKVIRPNAYPRLPTGETMPTLMVDWDKAYKLWKQSAE